MRRINSFLNQKLIDICQQAVQLEDLNSKIKAFLDEDLKDHCSVGSFNNGCLLMVVDNAVWASQLRYVLPELRDKLRKDAGIYQLSSIKISIGTMEEKRILKPKHIPKLSHKARNTITELSLQCTHPLIQVLCSEERI